MEGKVVFRNYSDQKDFVILCIFVPYDICHGDNRSKQQLVFTKILCVKRACIFLFDIVIVKRILFGHIDSTVSSVLH